MGLKLRALALCAIAACVATPSFARETKASIKQTRYCVVDTAGKFVTRRECKSRAAWLRDGYDAVRGAEVGTRRAVQIVLR